MSWLARSWTRSVSILIVSLSKPQARSKQWHYQQQLNQKPLAHLLEVQILMMTYKQGLTTFVNSESAMHTAGHMHASVGPCPILKSSLIVKQ